jgi:fructose-1,6-bisphosphatase/inositol monophosphatase family enzyme
LEQLQLALNAAATLLLRFYSAGVKTKFKSSGDPVTAADRAADQLLFEMLVRGKEGWLSEENTQLRRRKATRRAGPYAFLDCPSE